MVEGQFRANVSGFVVFLLVSLIPLSALSYGNTPAEEKEGGQSRVYVPYEKLKDVFETEKQGIFLPYEEFRKLWEAAQGRPARVSEAPFAYLISAVRFKGSVEKELGSLQMELTVDILKDGWIEVPVGLGDVAVSRAAFVEPVNPEARPLLRVIKGQYQMLIKGRGRYTIQVDFMRQLEKQPGLHILKFRLPGAAITTLELVIPEENLKVDVKPMLAATTTQEVIEGAHVTKLQAFMGSTPEVELRWRPTTQAAEEMKPVLLVEQFQHIHVDEALINHEVRFQYAIRRGGMKSFTIQLPGDFRVTGVEGENIEKWDIEAGPAGAGSQPVQILKVMLFSAAKESYLLKVQMERFLQEKKVDLGLGAILTQEALRRTGLIGVTHSARRLVEVADLKNLARVDTGRLPKELQGRAGTTAYRFISADYGGTLRIDTATPRITVHQGWMLGVEADRLRLRGRLRYQVERAGIFELSMMLPAGWKVESVGPKTIVDDHEIKTEGGGRRLNVLLKKEQTGTFTLELAASARRSGADEAVQFDLPLAEETWVQRYQGQLLLLLAEQLRAEVDEIQQFQPIALKQAKPWTKMGSLAPAMAYEFRAIDRSKPAGARFRIAVKPAQVGAVIHRKVNIQAGAIEQEAIIEYRIRYAPVDTFYLKMAAGLAEKDAVISGSNIKEKPRLDGPPEGEGAGEEEADAWAYYKVVLHSKVMGTYRLAVRSREAFQADEVGEVVEVAVEPILAAGKLSDQSGHIAIAKGETLAIGEPVLENLIPADPSSEVDLPYAAHRKGAVLAFKYNRPPYVLRLPVIVQKEAKVFTSIIDGVIIEQVLARDGMQNTHAMYLLATSQGGRISVRLPAGASLTAVLLNGSETPLELGASAEERIVRLPPSAGQVARFVLEISYSLKGASAGRLQVPTLPEDIPVQQTLWRVWLPAQYEVLGYDRTFARLAGGQSGAMVQRLRQNQPVALEYKLPGQGKALDFLRQGAPGELSVLAMGREVFSILVWVVILGAGAAMLKLGGYHRFLIILGAALLLGIIHLWLPLLVERAAEVGIWSAILVLLLWLGEWLYRKRPPIGIRRRKKRPKKPGTKRAATQAPTESKQDTPKTKSDKE